MTLEQNKRLKVLQVLTSLDCNGAENFVVNINRRIDLSRVQFDYLLHRKQIGALGDDVKSLGGEIYNVPSVNPLSKRYLRALDVFFESHQYDAVHAHLNCMSSPVLKAAKEHGVKVRVSHSHSSSASFDHKYPMRMVMRRKIPKVATKMLACGKDAGKWVYGSNDFEIIRNGVDTKTFSYNDDDRLRYRNELDISDSSFCVIHVGRFDKVKNHRRIITIFSRLVKLNPDSVLILVGEGDTMPKAKTLAEELGVQSKVMFLGMRRDVGCLMSAADAFLMPSLYEGLPLVLVEAQCSGLHCIVSDAVPNDCDITSLVEHVSLADNDDVWAERLLHETANRSDHSMDIRAAGYDSKEVAKRLLSIYLTR